MNIIDLHKTAWNTLLERRARLPHALLLSGRRGIGKFLLAQRFAAALLCEQPLPTLEACGQCPACAWLAQGNHPDFRLLQPEALAEQTPEGVDAGRRKPSQQITIDQVRALDDFLHLGTHRHGARVILVNPAEAMNRATANALLKSLEEPVPGTVFILVSSASERLLPTIRSRCQVLPIPLPSPELALAWLQAAGINKGAQWLALTGGSPLLAVELGADDERNLLDALLGEIARAPRIDPLAAAATLDRVVKADKRPAPLTRLIEWMQKWLVDLTLVREAQAPRYFVTQSATLARLAQTTDTRRLLALQRNALQYRMQSEQPLNSRLFLEQLFLSYAAAFSQP